MVSLSLDWIGDLNFRNSAGSPAIELHSATPEIASPPKALAYAVMACMGMDVVHMLQKGRQDLRSLSVSFEGERADEHPRRFVSMRLTFHITGQVDGAAIERAIELSRTKYCSVWNTLRPDIDLTTNYVLEA
jgi:putative redox protein